jgi:hypothetical protein
MTSHKDGEIRNGSWGEREGERERREKQKEEEGGRGGEEDVVEVGGGGKYLLLCEKYVRCKILSNVQ